MNYVAFAPDLFLAEQLVSNPTINALANYPGVNHIWIFDRSGSMYHTLPQLISDVIHRMKTLKSGDTLSLGWFSSESEFDWIVKGCGDVSKLEAAIQRYNFTLSTTCFSRILETTPEIIENLSSFSPYFSLMFFTDGYPVVQDYPKEIQAIGQAIDRIKGKITSAMLVGYGDYYNKDLMADMAQWIGGALVHSSAIRSFGPTLGSFIEKASEASPRIRVELQARADYSAFTIENNREIVLYQNQDNQAIFLTPSSGKETPVYVLTKTPPKGGKKISSLGAAEHAAAAVLLQRGEINKALCVLGKTGDIYFIDRVNQAFTVAEYGQIAEEIKESLEVGNGKAYRQGKKKNYVPKDDAFCLLDLLELLQEDPEAVFYPYHEDFQYKKIGPSAKTVEGYPKFVPNDGVSCPVFSFTWNESRLNLSLLARIEGTIELSEGADKLGFAQKYPTWVWRNYVLVRDGLLNVTALPISTSQVTYDKLRSLGVLNSKSVLWATGARFSLDLTKLPLINRKIAQGNTSAIDLCADVWTECGFEAWLKVYNFLLKEIEGDQKRVFTGLSPEQEEFLLKHGIGKNGFAPPSEAVVYTDHYPATEFTISIKGYSSLPKVDEVRKKLTQGKELTPVQQLFQIPLSTFEKEVGSQSKEVQIAWLKKEIEYLKDNLKRVRNQIQRTKFAVVVGKSWFTEFPVRADESSLTVDGKEFKIVVKPIQVKI